MTNLDRDPHRRTPVLLLQQVRRVLPVVVAVALLVVTAVPALANDPARARQWGLDRIGADAAHAVGQGEGVVIAVVDSGVDLAHEDLTPNLVPGIDVVDGDRTPQDGYGHGTHVAGIAAAAGDNGRGVRGVAPRASIMPVRVLGDDGSGSTADVVEGIEWAVANGADVINLSLGQAAQGIFGSTLSTAIEEAWAAGVVVVVSAGNEFVFSSGFGEEPALVVSATTREDRKPDYSNGVGRARWGMAAPGGGCVVLTCGTENGVFSTYWNGEQADVYAYLSGTSMAAPHVAGAAAVLLSLGLSPAATVDRLLSTAADIGDPGEDSTFGAGRLDLAAATAGLGGGAATPSPTPPTPTQTPAPPSPAATTPAPAAPASSAPEPSPTADAAPESDTAAPSATPAPDTTPTAEEASPTPSPDAAAGSPDPAAASQPPEQDALADGEEPDAGTDGWLVWLAVALVATAGGAVAVAARRARAW